MERGAWSSLTVFTPAAKLHPDMEQELYQTALADPRLLHAIQTHIIYVDTSPDLCLQRIKNQGSEFEQGH